MSTNDMQDDIEQPADKAGSLAAEQKESRKRVKLGNRHLHLPRSRILRVSIGVALVIGGMLGFLPVVGFWMIPLGILVLSVDLPWARRWRRRFVVWWYRRQGKDINGARE